MNKRVVIVGAGFAGVHLALKLANKKGFDIKLIAPDTYFEYHAALYRSATGRSPLEVAIPLKDFFQFAKNIEVIKDKVVGIDQEAKTLSGESSATYHYDEAVLALGTTTDFYQIPGLKENAYGVKSIDQALKLKRHLHEQLIDKDIESSYVVVGGGATGVELSAEMLSYLKFIRRKHGLKNQDFKVHLIEASPHVLSALPERFSKKVEKHLRKIGVQLTLNTPVKSETYDAINLPEGKIESHTVIWTAGVKNNPFFAENEGFELTKMQKVVVNDYLESSPNVYVVGDSAATQYSGMAQTALTDAAYIAENLLREQKGQDRKVYQPVRPIYAIPVGPRWAAVLWGRVNINGRAGWLLRRMADLRLYLKFLPLSKALITWRYGFVDEEVCNICRK